MNYYKIFYKPKNHYLVKEMDTVYDNYLDARAVANKLAEQNQNIKYMIYEKRTIVH